MRLARRLALATVAALAAVVFLATSAFGQSVEVVEEGDTHCSPTGVIAHVVTGGCVVHVVSNIPFQSAQHGVTGEVAGFFSCNQEFAMHLGERGSGYLAIDDASISSGLSCPITACDEGGAGTGHPEFAWPVRLEESPGGMHMRMTLCVRALNNPEGSAGGVCTFDVAFVEFGHQQHFEANDAPCLETSGTTEVSGEWVTEAFPAPGEVTIEVDHF